MVSGECQFLDQRDGWTTLTGFETNIREPNMTAATRLYAGVLFLMLVTVESGGHFLLRVLGGAEPEVTHPVMVSLFRAGHAHAGVLVVLALVAALYVEQTHYNPRIQTVVRGLFFLAPLLMSAGFFAAGATLTEGRPGPLIAVTYLGGACLAGGLLTLGIELIRARKA